METIEERAIEIAEKWKKDIIRGGEDISFTHLEYVAKQAAIEQDRISRQDERERCIKAAQIATCNCCMSHHIGCTEQDNCQKLDKIRKAIEEGDKI